MTDEEILRHFGSVPYFVDEVIEPWEQERDKEPFRKMMTWSSEGSVNIMRICGTMHPDYIGMTWREFLKKGRRMNINLRAFHDNPGYYTDIVKRLPGMFVAIIDGKGYVTEDGNHRTCIGKCFLYDKDSPFMHGVRVSESDTDMHAYSAFRSLVKKLPAYCAAAPVSTEVKRDDGNGWATHHYDVRIRLENRRRGYDAIFDAEEVIQRILPALGKGFLGRFSEYGKLLF